MRFLMFRLNQASRASRGMAKGLLHVLYVATDRRALSQLLLIHAWCHNIIHAIGVSHTAREDEFRQNSISQQLECIFFILYLDPRLADRLCLCVCIVIVERHADGILGVTRCRYLRHSIPRTLLLIINILLLVIAADHSRLVNGILVRDSTEQRTW